MLLYHVTAQIIPCIFGVLYVRHYLINAHKKISLTSNSHSLALSVPIFRERNTCRSTVPSLFTTNNNSPNITNFRPRHYFDSLVSSNILTGVLISIIFAVVVALVMSIIYCIRSWCRPSQGERFCFFQDLSRYLGRQF